MESFIGIIPKLITGAGVTLQVTIVALIFGVLIGLIAALGKLSKHLLPRIIATVYIEIIRGTPILVQALFFYLGIPMAIKQMVFLMSGDNIMLRFDPLIAGMIVCSLNSGAYVAEIFRAGIQSIDKGQMEAARSLGMSHKMAMKKVVFPQAVKVVLPPLGNEFVVLIKETSILSVIGVVELTKMGQMHVSLTYETFSTYIGVACVYFVMTFVVSRLVNLMERRMATSDRN